MPECLSIYSRVLRFWLWVWPILLIVVCMALLMCKTQRQVQRVDSAPGFALDDSWIHATIAKNSIEGKGWGLNAGQWVPLSTAPAWTLLMAAMLLLVGEPVMAGLVSAFLCQTTAGILAYLLMMRWTKNRFWSLLAALLIPLNPVLLWGYASGMEHPMVALSVLLCLYVFDTTRSDCMGRVFGLPLALFLGCLSRPELFALVPFAFLATGYQNLRGEAGNRMKGLRIFAMQSAFFMLLIAPYVTFNILTTGSPFPTAFQVKANLRNVGFFSALVTYDWSRVWDILLNQSFNELESQMLLFLKFNLVLTVCAGVGLLSFVRPFRVKDYGRSAMLLTLLLFLPLAIGVVSPHDSFSNYAHRYLAPFVPSMVLLGTLGMWTLWEHCGQKTASLVCLALVLRSTGVRVNPTIEMYARDVSNTNALYIDAGNWIKKNIPASTPLALNDIGGISYIIDNPILDVMGLGSPEIWPFLHGTSHDSRADAISQYLITNEYEYILISPHYYPAIHRASSVYEPIMRWESVYPTNRSIDPQILYRIHR